VSTPSGEGVRLAKRLEGVSESATLKLNSLVQSMKAQGVDVVNLTAGEPDFQVPTEVAKAMVEAVGAGKSKYTPAPGIPELRTLVADKTNRDQPSVVKSGGAWKAADVVVTNGGKQALFNTFLALVDLGDEVLIPSPYWLSYPEMVKIAGGIPKFLHAPFDQGYKLRPEALERALKAGPRTRILVLNSPSNPTGATYTREEFASLGEVLERYPGVWVISDEIYDRIVFDGQPFVSFLEACPRLRNRTVTVNGLSKSAAMTGWRVGWYTAQWASIAALKLPDSEFESHRAVYQRRRDLCLEILGKAGKMKVFKPGGAFYAFVGVGAYLKAGEDSIGFAERLLEGAKVAVVPGTPFGEPEGLRLSFATDEKTLQEGCARIIQYLAVSGKS
jgi:aspartate aminotransferase